MGNQVCVYHLEEVLAAVLVLVHTYTRGWDGEKDFRLFWLCRSHDSHSAESKYMRGSSWEDGKWLSVADK